MIDDASTKLEAIIHSGVLAGAFVVAIARCPAYKPGRVPNRPRAPDSIIVSGNDSVSIRANKRGQFVANGAINGERIRFLVDTGATLVTVSSAQARRLRLTPGKPITVNTAAGEAKAFLTRLSSVQLGGITLQGVNATIVPSYESEVALLGMSFLRHLSTENANGVMILKTLPPTRQ